MHNSELFSALQSWVAETYPGTTATEITIRLTMGPVIRLPVPAAAKEKPPAAKKFTKAYMNKVLRAVPKATEPPKTRRKIAQDNGIKFNSHYEAAFGLLKDRDYIHEAEPQKYRRCPK